ncbi:LytR family transcriptional regulator [Pseudoclavibacter sp. AY1H1]|nr:LytR family transcriptional regulator [Pseudoclavibacter sp. AY1H1]
MGRNGPEILRESTERPGPPGRRSVCIAPRLARHWQLSDIAPPLTDGGHRPRARGTMKRPTDPHPVIETLLNGGGDDEPQPRTRSSRRTPAVGPRRPITGSGRHVSRRRRTNSKFVRRRLMVAAAAAVCVTMVAGIGFISATYFQVVGNLADNAVGRADGTGTEISGWDGPVNILIMGSDSRDGQSSADYGEASGARSDVMMLLHVSADREDATLISIPRDTMLPTPECTTPDGAIVPAQEAAQINGALENGPFCSLDTIRDFTGLDIDHFIVVGFDGVIGITEAIGGVDVCVENDIADDYSGLYMTAGTHSLQGEAALAFLRTRHGFADGSDLGRIQAQQAFLASLARKVTSAGTLTNPGALYGLADSASKAMTVDEALAQPSSLVALAQTLANVDLDRIVMLQLPVAPYWADPNRVEPITAETDAIFATLRADQPLSFQDDQAADAPDGDSEQEGPEQPDDATRSDDAAAAPGEPLTLSDDIVGRTAEDTTCAS